MNLPSYPSTDLAWMMPDISTARTHCLLFLPIAGLWSVEGQKWEKASNNADYGLGFDFRSQVLRLSQCNHSVGFLLGTWPLHLGSLPIVALTMTRVIAVGGRWEGFPSEAIAEA